MGEVCVALGNQQSAAGGEEGKNPKEQKQLRLQAWCNVLQVKCSRLTVTQFMYDWHGEVLSNVHNHCIRSKGSKAL